VKEKALFTLRIGKKELDYNTYMNTKCKTVKALRSDILTILGSSVRDYMFKIIWDSTRVSVGSSVYNSVELSMQGSVEASVKDKLKEYKI
jgi:hypothetical protein